MLRLLALLMSLTLATAFAAPAVAQSEVPRAPGSSLVIPPLDPPAVTPVPPAAAPEAAAQAATPSGAQPLTPEERSRAVAMLRQILTEHPELVDEVFAGLPQPQKTPKLPGALQPPSVPAMPEDAATQLGDTGPYLPALGEADADVTVVHFFDYQCRYCRANAEDLQQLQDEDDKLRVIYREFPILGDYSVLAARAALAAAQQGKYEPMHKALIGGGMGIGWPTILEAARNAGVDTDRLRRDMESPALMAALQANRDMARALGIRGTPAFVIDGKVVSGAISLPRFRTLLADARAQHVGAAEPASRPALDLQTDRPASPVPQASTPQDLTPSELTVAPER